MLDRFVRNGGEEAVLADARQLPFRNQVFQLVICHRFLHRFPGPSRIQLLTELRRVSSNWGIVYYAVIHEGLGWSARISRRLNLTPKTGVFSCTLGSVRRELEETGWRVRAEAAIFVGMSAGHVFLVQRT